jgi:hypothetical protein
MAAWRRAIELSLGDLDTAESRTIAQSRYQNRWSSNADLVGQPRRRSTASDVKLRFGDLLRSLLRGFFRGLPYGARSG